MKTALIISSNVAASRVGSMVSAFCLRRLGVEAIVLPTTEFGRHPGWGAPGGGIVDPARLRDMWEGIKANNIHIDAVLTGYMAHLEHIHIAQNIITDVRRLNSHPRIWVDPVMGDNGRLYVAQDVAEGIKNILFPLADMTTPNLWEFDYLCATQSKTLEDVRKTVEKLDRNVLVSSVPIENNIGAILRSDNQFYQIAHTQFQSVPHGGGDALAAVFLAYELLGYTQEDAFAHAVSVIYDILKTAVDEGRNELPLIECQSKLIDVNLLTLERLT